MSGETGIKAFNWGNATQGIAGQIVYKTTTGENVDFTTGVTLPPVGVLLNAPKLNETAQVHMPSVNGDVVQMLVDGTTDILLGDVLKTNATGRGIKAGGKSTTYVTTFVYVVGVALEGFTVNSDGLISVLWRVLEGHWT